VTLRNRSILTVFVGALAATACAYNPSEKIPDKVFVTGSRVPVQVDQETGLPRTFSSVRVYSRNELVSTGRPDLRAAIEAGSPSITP
jgi:hypothetical protein